MSTRTGGHRLTRRLLVGGAVLTVCCLVIGSMQVTVPAGSCGSALFPGWSDDMATGSACEAAMSPLRPVVLVGLALGVLGLALGAVTALIGRGREA